MKNIRIVLFLGLLLCTALTACKSPISLTSSKDKEVIRMIWIRDNCPVSGEISVVSEDRNINEITASNGKTYKYTFQDQKTTTVGLFIHFVEIDNPYKGDYAEVLDVSKASGIKGDKVYYKIAYLTSNKSEAPLDYNGVISRMKNSNSEGFAEEYRDCLMTHY